MTTDKDQQYRPESYPKPTETDEQLKQQPEYITQPSGGDQIGNEALVTKDNPAERNADDKANNPDRTRNG